jgi:hypothetical protein
MRVYVFRMPRRLAPIIGLVALLTACGARTSLESDIDVGALDTGTSQDPDASSQGEGVLCALVDGIVRSCDAGDRAGSVQRCEPSEECLPRMIPNADLGYHTIYECCAGAPEKTFCVNRQFNARYVCR